jgi:hypothetical protein
MPATPAFPRRSGRRAIMSRACWPGILAGGSPSPSTSLPARFGRRPLVARDDHPPGTHRPGAGAAGAEGIAAGPGGRARARHRAPRLQPENIRRRSRGQQADGLRRRGVHRGCHAVRRDAAVRGRSPAQAPPVPLPPASRPRAAPSRRRTSPRRPAPAAGTPPARANTCSTWSRACRMRAVEATSAGQMIRRVPGRIGGAVRREPRRSQPGRVIMPPGSRRAVTTPASALRSSWSPLRQPSALVTARPAIRPEASMRPIP